MVCVLCRAGVVCCWCLAVVVCPPAAGVCAGVLVLVLVCHVPLAVLVLLVRKCWCAGRSGVARRTRVIRLARSVLWRSVSL